MDDSLNPPLIDWLPIGDYDYTTAPMVLLAAYIVPSEAAAENGSEPFLAYGIGSRAYKGCFSGILGSRPSHFAYLISKEDKP